MRAFRQRGAAVGGSPLGLQCSDSPCVPCVGSALRYETEGLGPSAGSKCRLSRPLRALDLWASCE
jgi:hypothetical protein